jgi:serine/threonine-protein kinase
VGALSPGLILGGTYRLVRLIGQGGMGSVYEATHERVPRRFAIKLLNPEVVGNPTVFERFQREAEVASSIGNEHIVQAFDFNRTDDGVPYMVLELLEGEDLAARMLARGPLTLEQATSMLVQVTSALESAHGRGVIHRDLKPQNIFLSRREHDEDFVKVLDFGISKILHATETGTRTGVVFGTPNYMAPEQAEGRSSEIDARTDIFALGSILYECLSGQLPFKAPTVVGTLYQVCHVEPEPLRKRLPGLPERIEQAIKRAMAKQRAERFASVAELREAFTGVRVVAGRKVSLVLSQTGSTPLEMPGNVLSQFSAPLSVPTLMASAPPAQAPAETEDEVTTLEEEDSSLRTWGVVACVVASVISTGFLVFARRPAQPPSPPRVPTQVAAPAAAAAPTSAAAHPSADPSGTIEYRLKLDPPDSQVFLDGKPAANPLHVPRDNHRHEIKVTAPGHILMSRSINADADVAGEQVLQFPLPETPKPHGKGRAPGPAEDGR